VQIRRVILALALTLASRARAESLPPTAERSPIARTSRQMLLVRADAWWSSSGTLTQYERRAGADWVAVGETPVDLGRNGMAWGRGLHVLPATGPFKAEGDRKSPAGAFALVRAFGTAEALPADSRGFPYLQSSASTYCVEDVRSNFYNQIIDSREVPRAGWERWSELRRRDGLFDWGVIVQQNAPETRKAAGSCVFLHVWRGPRVPTSGCTAMPRERIQALLRWLDPKAEPVLVQLPKPAFEALRKAWELP
jgi:L,D-peptidoglycan transpeptidase YkuD (ErfK/YbiS/YcfS/YnhG family)